MLWVFCLPSSFLAQLYFIERNYHQWHWEINTEEFLYEEPITSAQLEGALTTRKVAKNLLATGRSPSNKDEMMIVNNHRLMQAVKRHLDEPMSIELILKLHKIATIGAIDNDATPGEFRKDDNIIIADYFGNVVHQPPLCSSLNSLMQDFCDFANNDEVGGFIHPVIKAIILHFLIGFIHPFGDGNGRTARALFYWYMQKSGYVYFDYISISRLLHKAPKQYAQSYINTEQGDLDMTYFIAYQLKIITRAINDLKQIMQSPKQPEQTNQPSMIDIGGLNAHQHRLLSMSDDGQLLTAKQTAVMLGISESTARKILNELKDLNLVQTIKNGRGKAYILTKGLKEVR